VGVRLDLPDEAATRALAVRLAAHARAGDAIGLKGPLGAGKTTFARAFIAARAALSGVEVDDVPSPTFTLVQAYDFPGDVEQSPTVFHIDLYRIENSDETIELGLEDAFASGVCLIEWPEKGATLLPVPDLHIRITFGNCGRVLSMQPRTPRGRELLKTAAAPV